jgi:fatty-acyl-CoA synthase
MLGLAQDWPLLCHKVLDHAATQHARRKIVSCADDQLILTNYGQLRDRALRVAQRLQRQGLKPGDRIATLAASTVRHMEVWYGATGIGAVYHPVNPRLFHDQITFVVNHAADRVMFTDAQYVPLLEKIASKLPTIERYIVLSDAAHMPQTSLRNAVDYESWLDEVDGDYAWAHFDENTAAGLSYTSGTTGRPKGVLYSHRSIVLLSLTINAKDMYGFSARDIVMMAVPMFHANGWSWPFTAPMAGASLVLPGARLDGASLHELIEAHQVTISGGVPTVWQGLLDHLDRTGLPLKHLKRLFIGGSPPSRAMLAAFQDRHGVEIINAYGMTEMGPTGTACSLTPETQNLQGEARLALQQRQGRAPFLVEMKIVDDAGNKLPWNDVATGNLRVRGPCIVRRYYRMEDSNVLDEQGFFDTGDVAKIDKNGFMRITDRAKDLIKSGGEWISSIDLENTAQTHPAVAEAAAIAAVHPKWDERPLLFIVRKPDQDLSSDQMVSHLSTRLPKWWLPDAILFLDELPHTATGKLQKTALRERYGNYLISPDKTPK